MPYLSDEQQQIVDIWTAQGGAMLVSASAGSGKTRVLTECVRRLLSDSSKENFRILSITFTNKASDEMRERLKEIKGIKERTFINTIHAFGLDVLRAYRHELGYTEMPHIIERESDRKEILKDVFLQSPILEPYFNKKKNEISLEKHQSNLLNSSLQWISEQKRNLVFIDNDVYQYNDWSPERLHLYKEYNQHLQSQQLIEFDDILLLTWRILSYHQIASIYRRLYRYILVDEAQDLNFAQYQLIKTLCGDTIRNVLMVGDGNQAIYGYAGADKKYMFENFVKDFNAQQKKIEHNYRSSKAVQQLAQKIAQRLESSANGQYYDGVADLRSFQNETDEAKWVIRKIKELLEVKNDEFDRQVTLEKIAVLARNKFVFNELKRQLEADSNFQGNYYFKKGTEGLEPESTLIKVFDLGTRLIANKQGEVYWKQLLILLNIDSVQPFENAGLEMLRELKKHLSDEFSGVQINEYQQLLTAWKHLEKNITNFPQALNSLEENTQYITDENERNLAQQDIAEWREAWQSYIRNVSANSKSLADFRRYTAMGFNKSGNLKGLTLATVHSVKGLEFEIVFLIGMTEGTFPDYRAKTDNALQEERNNTYVAVTRAKRHVYITFPHKKMMPWGSEKTQIKSRFLNEIEESETLI